MSISILHSLGLDDWFEAYQASSPSRTQPAPLGLLSHPLKPHDHGTKCPQYWRCGASRFTSYVPHDSGSPGPLHAPSYLLADDDDDRTSPLPRSSTAPSITFRDSFNTPSSSKAFPVVASRAPLKPTMSFGGVSNISNCSYASTDLEGKCPRLTIEEVNEDQPRQYSHPCFYSSLVVLCSVNLMCGLNVTALATALPYIAEDLDARTVPSLWIATASLLTATLFHPLFMRLSVIDHKSLLLSGLALITGGSLVCALAKHATTLIVGRSIEGCGNAATRVLTHLILDQLVTTEQRRDCEQWVLSAFWLGTAMGPLVGGALAQTAGWPYIFYINIPVAVLGGLAMPFLVKLPRSSTGMLWGKLKKVDVLGWAFLSAATTTMIIAISCAGSVYPWSSWQVLLPLLIGTAMIVQWVWYIRFGTDPILPIGMFLPASAIAAWLGTLVHGILLTGLIYMIAVYFQTELTFDSTTAGVALLSWTLSFVLAAVAAGLSPRVSSHRLAPCLGWASTTLSIALLTLLASNTSLALPVALGLLTGTALGLLSPVLRAAMQRSVTTDNETVHVGSLHSFFGTLGMCLGLVIGNCVFLNRRAMGYDVSSSLRAVWIVMATISAVPLTLSVVLASRVKRTPGRVVFCLANI